MTRYLLAVLVLFLHPDARAQAVRPAPAPVPLIQQQPPSLPGNPVHTPVGAGASHGSLPGAQKATLPPSPNKRLLPPTKEPGLWAADGDPVASAGGIGVTVLGVDFDLGLELYPGRAAHECAKAVNDASDSTIHWSKYTRSFPEAAMRCIAARALLSCAESVRDEIQNQKRRFADFRAAHAATSAAAAAHWEREYCADVQLTDVERGYLAWLTPRTESVRPKD